MHLELASFKKSIKREASAYSVLKDEYYFDKFQRDFFLTAKSHDASVILDPTFTPGPSPEEKELFEAKQVFMYKVFIEALLTDMGRTNVRKYLKTTDAQAVRKEYSEYMTTVSKGASVEEETDPLCDQHQGYHPRVVLHFNSGDWMNSLTNLKECQNPSRWQCFRMLSRVFHSSSLLKPLMNTPPPHLEVGHPHTLPKNVEFWKLGFEMVSHGECGGFYCPLSGIFKGLFDSFSIDPTKIRF